MTMTTTRQARRRGRSWAHRARVAALGLVVALAAVDLAEPTLVAADERAQASTTSTAPAGLRELLPPDPTQTTLPVRGTADPEVIANLLEIERQDDEGMSPGVMAGLIGSAGLLLAGAIHYWRRFR